MALLRKSAVAAAILAAGALLLAACGGSSGLSKPQYEAQVRAIGDELGGSLSSTTSATTPKAAATALTRVQAQLRTAEKKLKAISPPDAAKAGHARMTKAVSELADELGPVIVKLKSGNLAALATVTSLKGFSDLQTAGDELTKAGYDIEG
jgi:hypothetical protein